MYRIKWCKIHKNKCKYTLSQVASNKQIIDSTGNLSFLLIFWLKIEFLCNIQMGVGDFNYLNKTKTECYCCQKKENYERINYNEECSAKRD